MIRTCKYCNKQFEHNIRDRPQCPHCKKIFRTGGMS